MRLDIFALVAVLATCGSAFAQQAEGDPPLRLCDPLMDTNTEDDDGEEQAELVKTARYDLEVAEPLASDQEIVATLFEDLWDTASNAEMARPEVCPGEPRYVVNWAQAMGTNDAGEPAPVAEGYFSLRRDGTFRFTYESRPHDGTWTLSGGRIALSAVWLNGGAPLEAQVERVTTPVEWASGNGEAVTSEEVVYRIGMFRLFPIDTTVRGTQQGCLCPGG